MALRDVPLKSTYDSDKDDILEEFYIPTLSTSTTYKRLAGFFSSSSLAVAARGIAQFVKNSGRMELICSAKLTTADAKSIESALKDPEQVIADSAIQELSSLEDEMLRDHVGALGWLVARNLLHLKIALVLNDDGLPLDEASVNRQGLFHQKVGILSDQEGNTISFSWSDNESA